MAEKKVTTASLSSLIVTLLLLSGCVDAFATKDKDKSDPSDALPPLQEVKILSALPSPDFATSGEVEISMLPLNQDGEAILDERVSVEATISDGLSNKIDDEILDEYYDEYMDYYNEELNGGEEEEDVELEVSPKEILQPSNSSTPWAFAINIDSSGSMSSNDPNRIRVDAAQQFVDMVLGMRRGTQLSVFDFGAGYTEGYEYSRLLHYFSSDSQALKAAIDECLEDGSTPLFESTNEILDTLVSVIPAGSFERAMLVLSDGAPDRMDLEPTVISVAQSNNIPINTVALGTGEQNEVMSDLANDTGGIFTSASSAADLKDAFENVAMGSALGYMVYVLKFPSNAIPTTKTSVLLTIKSGKKTQEVPLDIVPPLY